MPPGGGEVGVLDGTLELRVEIKADYGIVALGMLRFLFDGKAVAVVIEFRYSIAFGIVYPISEYCCLRFFFGRCNSLLQHFGKTASMKYVVAENQTNGVIAYKFLADDECLCKADAGLGCSA